jgi:dTDP-4-dehydrorhamnose 3,5-epimerase
MEIATTPIPGLVIMVPEVYEDDRGFVYESFSQRAFEAATGERRTWLQDNHTFSRRGVLRGLHYLLGVPQGKIIRCVQGSVYDVAVDIRRSSPTFREWVGIELSEDNRRMLWVPEGFAHGFLVTDDSAEVVYKMTEHFELEADRAIRWNDPDLAIEWPVDGTPILSAKDAAAPFLADAQIYD